MGRDTKIRSLKQRVEDAVSESQKKRSKFGSGCFLPAAIFTLGTVGLYAANSVFPDFSEDVRKTLEYFTLNFDADTFNAAFDYVAAPIVSGLVATLYAGSKIYRRHRSLDNVKDIEAKDLAINNIAHDIKSKADDDQGVLRWVNSFRAGRTTDVFSVMADGENAMTDLEHEKKLNNFLAMMLKQDGYLSALVCTYPECYRVESALNDFYSATNLKEGSVLDFFSAELRGDIVTINNIDYRARSFEFSNNMYLLYLKPVLESHIQSQIQTETSE